MFMNGSPTAGIIIIPEHLLMAPLGQKEIAIAQLLEEEPGILALGNSVPHIAVDWSPS